MQSIKRGKSSVIMRSILIILILTSLTASAGYMLWQGDKPNATRSLQLCERKRFLEFDQESDRWVALSTPKISTIVCPIAGTTGDLKIDGLQQPFKDTLLADKMIDVDCYTSARIKSGALPTQMPDGLYCNIPAKVD